MVLGVALEREDRDRFLFDVGRVVVYVGVMEGTGREGRSGSFQLCCTGGK